MSRAHAAGTEGQTTHASGSDAQIYSYSQANDLDEVELQLQRHKIEFVSQQTQEGPVTVRQVFFHDPDGNMIEVCNCDEFPVCRIASAQLPGLDLLGDEQPGTPPARGLPRGRSSMDSDHSSCSSVDLMDSDGCQSRLPRS